MPKFFGAYFTKVPYKWHESKCETNFQQNCFNLILAKLQNSSIEYPVRSDICIYDVPEKKRTSTTWQLTKSNSMNVTDFFLLLYEIHALRLKKNIQTLIYKTFLLLSFSLIVVNLFNVLTAVRAKFNCFLSSPFWILFSPVV